VTTLDTFTPLSAMVAQVKDKLQAWWDHEEQATPCLLMTGRAEVQHPVPPVGDLERYWHNVEEYVERRLLWMANRRYYGLAMPHFWPDWGASTFSGMLGCRMDAASEETTWAQPCCETLDAVLEVDLQPESRFYRTVMAVTELATNLSADRFFVAVYPIVGIADILATLYGTEQLLVAMAEQPAAVMAAMRHVTALWLRTFPEVQDLVQTAGNPGTMNWMAIWAPGTSCCTQEDFSYMISDEMFRSYCLPPLLQEIDAFDYPMYHLDGAGALSHLDTLLGIEKLRAIQWVPGAGHEDVPQWYELIRRILAGGKSVEVFARPDEIDDLVRNVGARGLLISTYVATQEEAERLLQGYPQDV
jgi:hypothetical protein